MTARRDPRLARPYLSLGFLISPNRRNSVCPLVIINSPSESIIVSRDRKPSFDGTEPPGVRTDEQQLYPNIICKSSEASCMLKCYVVE